MYKYKLKSSRGLEYEHMPKIMCGIFSMYTTEKVMSELVEVLDEQGVYTGATAPRAEVHAQGLWHATVHIYTYRIVENHIELLVHLRSTSKDLYPNTWDPVLGGHIQAGRTALQTVVEELNDEIGIQISTTDVIVGPILKIDKGLDKEFNHIFAYPLPVDAILHFKDQEVQKVRWMKFDDILQSIQTSPSEWRPTIDEFKTAHSIVTSLVRR